MGRYQVQAPDGHTYEFEAPDDATPDQLDAMTREVAGYGSKYPVAEQSAPPSAGEQLLDNTKNDVAGIAQGAAYLPDLAAEGVGKVLSVIPNAISQMLHSAGHEEAAQWIQDNITHNLANPLQVGDKIEELAPTPDTTAGKINRFAGQMVGGVVGMPASAVENVVGRIVGAAPKALPATKALTEEQELMQAADRHGIDVLPADVGGPMTRRATSTVTQTIAGGSPIIKAAQRMVEQAKGARDRIAQSIGNPMNNEAAGETAAEGAQKYIKGTASRIGRIYDIAAARAGDIRLPLTHAKEVLDEQIARLKEVPGGGAGLDEAEAMRKSLDGEFTVQGIRDMRTEMFVAPEFRATPVERRMKQIVNAAAQDIEQGLRDAGKMDAADAFKAADTQWQERLKTISRVIEPIIGKADNAKSGEEIVAGLERAMKGNGRRFEAFVKALPEEEQQTVRASLIGRMGQAKAAKQGSEGEEFSLDTFLTNWNNMGERAKAATFGPEAKAALNDLAKIAEGTREAQGYRNMSNTGGVVGNLLTLFSGVGGIATFGKTVGAQYGLGKLLASPRFARWLARAPKAQSPRVYVDKLKAIAAAEPAIRNDLLSLHQRLSDAFGTVPMQAVASDNQDSGQTPR